MNTHSVFAPVNRFSFLNLQCKRRLLTVIPILLATLMMLPASATDASAHHRHYHHRTYTAPNRPVGQMQQFETEGAAQSHCPSDQVVWLNTNSGIYHEKGMRWYGNTREGAYVCRREADGAGDRDTRNGQ